MPKATRSGTVRYVYNDSQGHYALLGQHTPKFSGVRKTYLLSISGEPSKYLFVCWARDTECTEACCKHSYSLVRLGKEVENLLGNAYGCDV